ncbi:MAG TPA: hypothetical protein VLW50_12765 [Streptosporangiaceae bacterium]|nr:hypothetical protein [Streptosporangiaceae bacterium]
MSWFECGDGTLGGDGGEAGVATDIEGVQGEFGDLAACQLCDVVAMHDHACPVPGPMMGSDMGLDVITRDQQRSGEVLSGTEPAGELGPLGDQVIDGLGFRLSTP